MRGGRERSPVASYALLSHCFVHPGEVTSGAVAKLGVSVGRGVTRPSVLGLF